MADIKTEIAAFEAAQSALEASHLGKWALFHDAHLVDVFDDFDVVAAEAVRRFGRGPYLIRQIGSRAVTLPASLHERKQQRLS
jgi:hypothetical protein